MHQAHPHDESSQRQPRTNEETTVMNMWTQETLQAETDYRRQQLRRLASHRRMPVAHRSGNWYRWLAKGLRH
jgi:hypothetical protein